LAVPNLTRADAAARAALLRVDSYQVELDLTDGSGRPGERVFRARTTVHFSCAQPGESTFIDVIADRFHEVALNGAAVDVSDYSPEDGVALAGLAADNTLVVDADLLYTNTGEGLHRFTDPVDGAVYLYSQFETADAKRMFACFDQPDLKGTFTLSVTAPADWEVISNGRVADAQDRPNGARRTDFAATKRISPYITALVAGPYHKVTDSHHGIDLGVYCRKSLAQHLDADEIFDVTKRGFDYYHEVFDYPYAFDKYDQLFVPEFNAGAMENAACVTFLEDYVFRSKVTDASYERRAETILHEMAHMWFGDLVTMRWWDDLWLNESFATFMSTLAQSRATRWTEAWTTFATVEKSWAYRQDQLPSTHPVAADIPDVQAVEVNFDGITYAKGASVLKQLAAYVGIDEFLAAMKVYFREHEYGNTTLADLLSALEESSGRDLSNWSAQWLQTSGINTLRPEFEVDGDGKFTSFAIRQEAVGEHNVLRDHRLAIGLYSGSPLQRVKRVELDVAGERTEVPEMIGVDQPDLTLVNDDDLTYAKIRLDERSLATLIERIGEFTESLPRALAWSAAWDMTRDAEWAARDFVRLVLGGIGAESRISVVQALHRQVRAALGSYADPAWAPIGWGLLADAADAAMRAAEPGSDHQLAWARMLAAAARADPHVTTVAALLDGSQAVDGLVVDTELRWALLHSLVAVGAAGDAEIAAEEARDATAAGQRHAAAARALRPTAEAKAEAWRLATEDDSLPNAINEAIIRGFAHPAQEDLLAPYVDRYFEVIADVWSRRTSETAQNVVEGLYPSIVSAEVIEAADAWLADGSHPPALRRLVVEGRDTTRRALRARERDGAAG
jgi:aminopeptidase N